MSKIKTANEVLDKREVLLRSAIKLFAENGFDAVSTRMIAKDAGVNLALISYYFNSKEGLIDAILEESVPAFGSKLRAIQKLNLSAVEKLHLALDVYIDRILTAPNFSKIIYRELSMKKRSENVERLLAAMRKNKLLIEEIIQEGQQKNQFKQDVDYKMLLLSFFSSVSTLVNSSNLCGMLLNETEETIQSETLRIRVKTYFKQLFSQFLLPSSLVTVESK